MKTQSNVFLFAPLFAFLLFSCSGDDEADALVKEGGPFEISELTGNWEATSATFSNGNMFMDIIDQVGSVSMSVQSSGRFTLNIDPSDRPAYAVSGEMFWEKWEGKYYFAIEWADYPGDWDTYGATLTTSTFSINGGSDSGEYDFDNDGTFETASIGFSFVRA